MSPTVRLLVLTLLTGLLSTNLAQKCIPDSQGKQFVFAIPPNRDQDEIGIVIQPTTDFTTSVNVSVPLRTGPQYRHTITLPPESGPFTQTLPSDLIAMNVSGVTDTAIAVSSDRDVSLTVYNYRPFSMDTFSPFPISDLGKEYFAAVYPGALHLTATVHITALSQPSHVTIYVSASVTFQGVTYNQDDVISHDLNPYETIQLEPTSIQFSGTRIVTNTSVTVTIGTTCANIPTDILSCDHLSEQLKPFDRWGTAYTVGPFPQRSEAPGYVYQIVAGRDSTDLQVVDGATNEATEMILNMGEHFLREVSTQSSMLITASKPVMVVLYAKGTTFFDRDFGDATMAIVPSHSQYVDRVEFAVPDFSGVGNCYVGVTAVCSQLDDIMFDSVALAQIAANEEYQVIPSSMSSGDAMCTRWYKTTNGSHVMDGILTGNDVMFTVLVYCFGGDIAHSFYPGYNNEQQTCVDNNVEVACSSLPQPDITTVNCTVWEFSHPLTSNCTSLSTVNGDTMCTFSCQKGYEIQGSPTSTCLIGGYMSGCLPTCQNMDECQMNDTICGDAVGMGCIDTMGSFMCDCLPGWTKVNGECIDINECDTVMPCINGICTNTPGSFECTCDPGRTLHSDGVTCLDVDECLVDTSCNGITETCVNTNGSFRCECAEGYSGSPCTDVNECSLGMHTCDTANQGTCTNTPGSYFCGCEEGWKLNSDQRTCSDIDECFERAPCDVINGVCTNTIGSYTCGCVAGWRLDANGISCSRNDTSVVIRVNGTDTGTGTSGDSTGVNVWAIAGSAIGGMLILLLGLGVAFVCLRCCCVSAPKPVTVPDVESEDTQRELAYFTVLPNLMTTNAAFSLEPEQTYATSVTAPSV